MKFKKIFCILLSAVIIAAGIPVYVSAEAEVEAPYVEDEIIFKYDPSLSRSRSSKRDFLGELDELGITELSQINTYELTTASVDTQPVTYVAKINDDVKETCRELENLDVIAYAEPNYLFQTDSFSMPGEVKNQTNLYKNYQKWYLEDILHLPEAWETYETAGDGVTIAVIDNGFYTEATDFPTNLWDDGDGHHGKNTADNNYDLSPVYKPNGEAYDDTQHGSNVAGIIGMTANGANCIGAAYNAELMLLKIANNKGGNEASTVTMTADSFADAIYYAKEHGADIISMSIGLTGSSPKLIKEAAKSAYDAGIVLVASAGNSATPTSESRCYPAAYDFVIGVMASDRDDTTSLTFFSNYDTDGGIYYDIAAPGFYIIGCSVEKGRFSAISGTSQATPLVASCIALFVSAYPNASVEGIYSAVRNSSKSQVISNSEVSTDKTYKYDIMNALELLDYAKIKPEIEFDLTTNVIHNPKKGYVYGLDEGFADIASYITVKDGTGTAEFVPTALGNGTGSVFNVYTLDSVLYKSYTVILFGDINGDCKIDGQDAVLARCAESGMIELDTPVKYAADVDSDGDVAEGDALEISEQAIGLNSISQVR